MDTCARCHQERPASVYRSDGSTLCDECIRVLIPSTCKDLCYRKGNPPCRRPLWHDGGHWPAPIEGLDYFTGSAQWKTRKMS